jgi:hypothetical protein
VAGIPASRPGTRPGGGWKDRRQSSKSFRFVYFTILAGPVSNLRQESSQTVRWGGEGPVGGGGRSGPAPGKGAADGALL